MTLRCRAGHLPSLAAEAVQWRTLRFAAHDQVAEIEVPVLDDAQMSALARHVRASARRILQALSVDTIVRIVDRAVMRLLDRADPLRRELDELLPIVTGYDPEMVRLGLDAGLQTFRAPQLHRFLAQDFPNPKVLDGFHPSVNGGMVRAYGPRLLVHSWAGNVPGLPLWSLACGLLVKAGNIGKLPSAEPVFASLFARLLTEVHPPLGDCLAMVWWQGGASDIGRTLYREADTVLAYGGNAALAEVRDQVPVTTRFLGFGHKLGVALVGRPALDRQRGPAIARLIAQDLVRHEQQGCYSPHGVYVERDGAISPRMFAQHVAAELASLARRHPRRVLALEESVEVAGWRQAAEWQATAAGGNFELLADDDSTWAVAFSAEPQPLSASPGQRCVRICGVDALDDVARLLEPHADFLQTVGVATAPDELYRLASLLGQIGVTRIAAIGAMTLPEAGWHHDGRSNLADLVRMVDIEPAAERAADRLASYAQEHRP